MKTGFMFSLNAFGTIHCEKCAVLYEPSISLANVSLEKVEGCDLQKK